MGVGSIILPVIQLLLIVFSQAIRQQALEVQLVVGMVTRLSEIVSFQKILLLKEEELQVQAILFQESQTALFGKIIQMNYMETIQSSIPIFLEVGQEQETLIKILFSEVIKDSIIFFTRTRLALIAETLLLKTDYMNGTLNGRNGILIKRALIWEHMGGKEMPYG